MTSFYGCGNGGTTDRSADSEESAGIPSDGILGGSSSSLEPEVPSSVLKVHPITEWDDEEELAKTEKMMSDFKINGVAFDKLFLSNINVEKGGRLVPVLFTSDSLAGRKHVACNNLYVEHSKDSACTMIAGYVKFKDVCVYVTAMPFNPR